MGSTNFQIGDRVRLRPDNVGKTAEANRGRVDKSIIYTVCGWSRHDPTQFFLEEVEQAHGRKGWWFHRDDFELVERPTDPLSAWDRAFKGM